MSADFRAFTIPRKTNEFQYSIKHFLQFLSYLQKRSLMNTIKKRICASLCLVFIWIYPQASAAENGFTGEQFLTWEKKSQHTFIANSISMIWLVARQNRRGIADCLDEWYPEDTEIRRQRRGFIIDSIAEHPTYHPQAVLLANVQKRCGDF